MTRTETAPAVPEFVIVNGTRYSYKTDHRCIEVLERFRNSKDLIRVFLGDPETGRSWLEESHIAGRIGRSTGKPDWKIPLIVGPGEDGGPGLLDACIVALQNSKLGWLWRHPRFHVPELRCIHFGPPNRYGVEVMTEHGNWITQATFPTQHGRMLYLALMRGERFPSRKEMTT